VKTELHNTLKSLQHKGVILYPTDTVWGIGCDATDKIAVEKIFKIKKRSESKSLIILVDSLEMLQRYIEEVPNIILKTLESFHKPTTVIYKKPKRLANNVIASDNTVAIRVVQDIFCKELIKQFGKPIVSTSANHSGKPTPKSFKEIELSILNAVDYVVNLHQYKKTNSSSRIVNINEEGEIVIIRE